MLRAFLKIQNQFYQMVKVVAVVVTNNRLALLEECLAALKRQSFLLADLIVVDNGSTDGTIDWLKKQHGLSVIEQENLGGSGGFYTGLKAALATGAEWVWLMDDDTICSPDSLQILTGKINGLADVGFIGSKAVWNDGEPHLMNIPAIKPSFHKYLPFNKFDDRHVLLVETCSFVSLLINSSAVENVGLPYKEFFIWGDDQEYTGRITKAGYLGFYCPESVVLHKTGINYFPDFYRETVNNLWKHSYGFRNEFFMIKKNKGFIYFIFWLILKVAYTSAKLVLIRKDNRFKFIKVLCNSARKAIFFNPKIDMV
jgi:rhamnopyranosyl-N-acetylglucosaminyl-diphospho-decaprenol beta-1,3/1,4-galactofuranosyltransferase